MSLNDTSADVAKAIAQSKQLADQEWLADYIIGFLKSPSWVTPVMEYIEQHCIIFDMETENKREYTVKHNEFRALIDGLLAAHLLEVSIGEKEFQQFIQDGLVNKSLHHILVEQLLAVDDFATFKAMMVQKNKQLQMQAIQQIEVQRQEVIQQVASDVTESIVSVQAQPELQDETVCEDEEVLSPTSGPGQCADWSLYDDEDKMLSEVLRLSEEQAIKAISDTVGMSDIRKEQEEAEMSLAMALSVQVEEDRQKRLQSQVEDEAPPDSGGASCSAAGRNADAPHADIEIAAESEPVPAEPPQSACEQPSQPEQPPQVVSAAAAVQETSDSVLLEEKPFSIAEMDALDNSRPRKEKKVPLAMPRMVTLAPVKPPVKAPSNNVTTATFYEDGGRSGPMPVKANVLDMKAPSTQPASASATTKQPVSRPAVCAAACVPTPQRPTAEEMRQRTDHLKQQRDLLVQKKKQEREQKLQDFKKIAFGNKGVDSQVNKQPSTAKMPDSQQLISQLTAQPEPDKASEVSSKEAARAAQMRQALTTKLKESLYRSLTQA